MPVYGSAVPSYFEGQDQLLRRQILQRQLAQQKAQESGLAALAQQYGMAAQDAPPQVPPAPQAPAPGQASQPMAQQPAPGSAGPVPPPPQGAAPGFNAKLLPGGDLGNFRRQLVAGIERTTDPQRRAQNIAALQQFDAKFGGAPGVPQGQSAQMPPPPGAQQAQPPQAPQGAQGQQPLPPYTEPSAPKPPEQAQQQIPTPPPVQAAISGLIQSKLPSLQEMSKALQKQGITGMPLFYALQQHGNMLNAEGKQQLQMLTEQVKAFQAQTAARGVDVRQQGVDVNKDREARLKAGAMGETPLGAASIDLKQAQAAAARAKANVAAAEAGKGSVSPETVDFYARQSLAGDNSWQTGLARGKVGQQLIAAVKDRIPQLAKESGVSPEDASVNKSERASLDKTLNDRQKYLGVATQFVNNFTKQADLVEKHLKPGAAGGMPALNKWIQSGRKAVAGDPDVSALDTAIRGLAREHQRIVTGVTSNAQLHASAQATADELMNTAQTPDQVRAVLKVMREEAENAVSTGKQEVDSLKKQMGSMGAGKKDSGPKPIKSDEEYNALPSGTEFIAPDGSHRRKP